MYEKSVSVIPKVEPIELVNSPMNNLNVHHHHGSLQGQHIISASGGGGSNGSGSVSPPLVSLSPQQTTMAVINGNGHAHPHAQVSYVCFYVYS